MSYENYVLDDNIQKYELSEEGLLEGIVASQPEEKYASTFSNSIEDQEPIVAVIRSNETSSFTKQDVTKGNDSTKKTMETTARTTEGKQDTEYKSTKIIATTLDKITRQETDSTRQENNSTKETNNNKNSGIQRRFFKENDNSLTTVKPPEIKMNGSSNAISLYINNSHQIFYNKTHYSIYFIEPLYGIYDINNLWSEQKTAKLLDDGFKLPLSKNNEDYENIFNNQNNESLRRSNNRVNLKAPNLFSRIKIGDEVHKPVVETDLSFRRRILKYLRGMAGLTLSWPLDNPILGAPFLYSYLTS